MGDFFYLFSATMVDLSVVWVIFWIVFSLAFTACTYYVYCAPQQKISDKLGYGRGWMAYIPVVRNVQRMKMTGMSLWKFLFVGSSFTYLLAFLVILGFFWMFVAMGFLLFAAIAFFVMIMAYVVLSLIFSFEYYSIISRRFGFSVVPTTLLFMFVPAASQIFMYLIAFSDRYDGKPLSEKPAVTPAPTPVMPETSGKIGIEGLSGMYSGVVFEMKGADVFTIGRDGALSNIIISANGEKVSRRHCAVRYIPTNNTYEVTDYSSNGTFYGNARLVKEQPVNVPRGTILVIGDKMNQFKLL